MRGKIVHIIIMMFFAATAMAQKPAVIDNKIRQKIFSGADIEILEDSLANLSLPEILADTIKHRFKTNTGFYPGNPHTSSAYWYRLKINFKESLENRASIFEFYDQTTDHITVYQQNANGRFEGIAEGAAGQFSNRLFRHKNFEVPVYGQSAGVKTYYVRIRSASQVNVIIVYRQVGYFIYYALTEYLTYGIFYGMILIFCFHNLLMFTAVKKRSYLFYVLYILSVGLYEMCTDGIAFQYLWPNAPGWNEYAYGTALYFVSIFALLFTRDLLMVRDKNYRLYQLINLTIGLRTAYYLLCLFAHQYFIYKFVEFVPLSLAFITGITVLRGGFKPARFFVLGYTFLFLGFMCKAISVIGWFQELSGVIGFYSLGISFILEMTFLSFAIGDQVRIFRREKEAAAEATILQMRINSALKDSLNQELEIKVAERTREVVHQSEHIFQQASIIEEQNKVLVSNNEQLEKQAAEISMMNLLLERDNILLKDSIEKVTDARALSTELTFEEFSAKYPDQESCNKFLSDLKWASGFVCTRCESDVFHAGRMPHSRRCSKCGYDESVLFNTIFQNNRIAINKAFYIVYLVYTTKGSISSYQLSEKIGIRQSTCWQYAIRVKKVMTEYKRDNKKAGHKGWSSLVLNRGDHVKAVKMSPQK